MNAPTLGRRVHQALVPVPKLRPPINPALLKHNEERAEVMQARLADRITAFAGSMLFVYIHIVWFGCWIVFGVEPAIGHPHALLVARLDTIPFRLRGSPAGRERSSQEAHYVPRTSALAVFGTRPALAVGVPTALPDRAD